MLALLPSNRTFQLWEYKVSHGSLLIRSPRNLISDSNVDIIFVGVEYAEVPRFLVGLNIVEASPDEVRLLEIKLGRQVLPLSVRVLSSGGQRFLIVAANLTLDENKKDIFESPFESSDKGLGSNYP
jgi:hypothetical protein